jgi:glutathionyl-hydroquinone reductase
MAPQHLDKKENSMVKNHSAQLICTFKDGFDPYNPENKFDLILKKV